MNKFDKSNAAHKNQRCWLLLIYMYVMNWHLLSDYAMDKLLYRSWLMQIYNGTEDKSSV